MAGRFGGNGAQRIAMERQRQKGPVPMGEGWDAAHDKGHADELVVAAACYAIPPARRELQVRSDPDLPTGVDVPKQWPWDAKWWKPTPDDRVRELEKAGALIAAAIDDELARLDAM